MAVAVIDDWHRRGIACVLVGELIAVAARDGIVRLSGTTLAENAAARNLLRGLGFQATGAEGDTIDYALEIAAHGAEPAAFAAA
jgi:ribosomal protein S18 acetylase RimI-like enzyme